MTAILKVFLSSLATVVYRVVLAAASEKILTRIVIVGLKKLASKTTNTVDDELVKDVAKELGSRKLSEAQKEIPENFCGALFKNRPAEGEPH